MPANPFRARKRLGFSGSGRRFDAAEAEPSRPLTRCGDGPSACRRTLSARGRGWGSAAPGGASMLPGQSLRGLLRGAAAARARADEPFPRAEEVVVQRLRAALRCCRGRAFAASYAVRRRPERVSANPFRARKRLWFSGSGRRFDAAEAEPSRPLTRRGDGPSACRRTLSARGRGCGSAAPGGASMLPGQGLRDLLRGAATARARVGEPFPRAEEVGAAAPGRRF